MPADKFLDMNGQVCPIPAAETRKILKSMSIGQTLEVVGDFTEACVNVSNIAKKNGGDILEQETGPNFYRVVIKKVQ
jgi:TusA-related sulfurtransferase